MNILKNLYNYLQEVIIKWREESRIRKNARRLTSGSLEILLERTDSVSLLAYTMDSSLVRRRNKVVPWNKFYKYVEYIESNFCIFVVVGEELKKTIDAAINLAKKYPQMVPPDIVEVSPRDIY